MKLRSIIQCPHCGFKVTEKMPVAKCVESYHCQACGVEMVPREGECCIFCSYGSVPCPKAQQAEESAAE